MARRSRLDVSRAWDEPINRYAIIMYICVCGLLIASKLANWYVITWPQVLLPEIFMAIAIAFQYIFKGLNAIIPTGNWRLLRPGNTFIWKQPNRLSRFIFRVTYTFTPWKKYCRKITESRHRQGFWN